VATTQPITAAHRAMPCVSLHASLAGLIRRKPEEIALTTCASPGVAAVAHGLTWKAGDESIAAKGEFPPQYATWKPMEERGGVRLKIVAANVFVVLCTAEARAVASGRHAAGSAVLPVLLSHPT
jgi:selenocysteine lyase/cysteine desulfurase